MITWRRAFYAFWWLGSIGAIADVLSPRLVGLCFMACCAIAMWTKTNVKVREK